MPNLNIMGFGILLRRRYRVLVGMSSRFTIWPDLSNYADLEALGHRFLKAPAELWQRVKYYAKYAQEFASIRPRFQFRFFNRVSEHGDALVQVMRHLFR